MTGEHLDVILKNAQAKADKTEKDGYLALPEGSTLTFYVSHDGAMLTVGRVESVRVDGELVFARTAKRETYALARSDVFAVASEGTQGQPARRAGFGS
jgi:hypothetical protein